MAARSRADKIWNAAIAGLACVVVLTLGATAAIVLRGDRPPSYSQATPDDVIRSASLMVRDGHARLLPNLIYAESDGMRGSLNALGIVLGHMEKLAAAIKDRFPEDTQKLRAEADAAIRAGKPPAVLGALTEQFRNSNGPPNDQQEQDFRELTARIFADPYGWIAQHEDRLSTVMVTDDLASVLLDGKPLAGVGLTLKLDAGKWYVALPTNLPPIARVMPRAPEQWKMINSLFKIIDNTVVELTGDVKEGRLTNLKAIGDKAREKTIFPAGLWFGAYAADMDARHRIDRNVRQYRERLHGWAESRARTPVAGVAGVSDKLVAAMSRIGSQEISPLARARKPIAWPGLTDKEFEDTLSEWLSAHGLDIQLEGPLSGDAIDAAIERWEAGPGNDVTPHKPK